MAMTLICNSIAGVLRISCWHYWDILRSLTASNSTSCFFHHPGKLHPKNKQTKQLLELFATKKNLNHWRLNKKIMEQLRKLPVIRSNGSTIHALAVARSSVGCRDVTGSSCPSSCSFLQIQETIPGMISVRFPKYTVNFRRYQESGHLKFDVQFGLTYIPGLVLTCFDRWTSRSGSQILQRQNIQRFERCILGP